MKCYFGGLIRKSKSVEDRTGVCNFSIPELGMLYRTVFTDDDEMMLYFTSLLSLFEFLIMNKSLFKNVSSFDLYTSNSKFLRYIEGKEETPIAYESVKSTIMLFIKHNNHMQFCFFEISKKLNVAFFKVDDFVIDMKLSKEVNNLMGDIDDSNKD